MFFVMQLAVLVGSNSFWFENSIYFQCVNRVSYYITLYILINPCPVAAAVSLEPFMSFSARGASRNLTRCTKQYPRGVAKFRIP